eukprot:6281820-Pyramimonas_sp.AAC.1
MCSGDLGPGSLRPEVGCDVAVRPEEVPDRGELVLALEVVEDPEQAPNQPWAGWRFLSQLVKTMLSVASSTTRPSQQGHYLRAKTTRAMASPSA